MTAAGASEAPAADLRLEALLNFYNDEQSGPGPKRARLCRAMLKMVAHAFWNPGDRLPTDVEFARRLPVSVATVQGALRMLADQSVVTRKQREGTFVAAEKHLKRETAFFNFTDADGSGLAPMRTRHIRVDETAETGPWSGLLGLDRRYLRIRRIVEIDDAFRILSILYLADPNFRVLLALPAEALRDIGIRELLHVRFGRPAEGMDWQVSFDAFDRETCGATGTADGTVGQRFDVRMWTANRAPLGFHRIWVPPNDRAMLIRA